jgi:CRISPR/Cas system-associated exonuclease Cas4 (RecB family)
MNGQEKPETEVKLISETYGVMGVIDAIYNDNGKTYLTDYKTSKKDTLTQDLKVQMAIYALLYQDNFGILPDTIVIDFLKLQKPIPFPITEEFTQYAIKMCKDIHEKTASTNEEDYPCQCGGWCEKDFL